jgi:hypothetical protein
VKFKPYWYLVPCAVVLFQSLGIAVIVRRLGIFADIDFEWTAELSCGNVFTLMTASFHWPYEPEKELTMTEG